MKTTKKSILFTLKPLLASKLNIICILSFLAIIKSSISLETENTYISYEKEKKGAALFSLQISSYSKAVVFYGDRGIGTAIVRLKFTEKQDDWKEVEASQNFSDFKNEKPPAFIFLNSTRMITTLFGAPAILDITNGEILYQIDLGDHMNPSKGGFLLSGLIKGTSIRILAQKNNKNVLTITEDNIKEKNLSFGVYEIPDRSNTKSSLLIESPDSNEFLIASGDQSQNLLRVNGEDLNIRKKLNVPGYESSEKVGFFFMDSDSNGFLCISDNRDHKIIAYDYKKEEIKAITPDLPNQIIDCIEIKGTKYCNVIANGILAIFNTNYKEWRNDLKNILYIYEDTEEGVYSRQDLILPNFYYFKPVLPRDEEGEKKAMMEVKKIGSDSQNDSASVDNPCKAMFCEFCPISPDYCLRCQMTYFLRNGSCEIYKKPEDLVLAYYNSETNNLHTTFIKSCPKSHGFYIKKEFSLPSTKEYLENKHCLNSDFENYKDLKETYFLKENNIVNNCIKNLRIMTFYCLKTPTYDIRFNSMVLQFDQDIVYQNQSLNQPEKLILKVNDREIFDDYFTKFRSEINRDASAEFSILNEFFKIYPADYNQTQGEYEYPQLENFDFRIIDYDNETMKMTFRIDRKKSSPARNFTFYMVLQVLDKQNLYRRILIQKNE